MCKITSQYLPYTKYFLQEKKSKLATGLICHLFKKGSLPLNILKMETSVA